MQGLATIITVSRKIAFCPDYTVREASREVSTQLNDIFIFNKIDTSYRIDHQNLQDKQINSLTFMRHPIVILQKEKQIIH